LRVRKGTGGMQALGDEDKENIHATIDQEVLEKQNITFRSNSVEAVGEGRYRVQGELTLAGSTQPLSFELVVDDGAVSGSATVTQTRWGRKPFSALFGTLKVLDEVEVQLQSR
jgi:polyisoprenoid-binding protein YceI